MLYQIMDGSVSAGGTQILSHINFEIKGKEKIAVVGRNGAGKTTLLRLICGELDLDRDDSRQGEGIFCSRRLSVGMLHQQVFSDLERTVEEELLQESNSSLPMCGVYQNENREKEWEYDRLLTGFGFKKEDKKRKLSSFSGGEQTKLGFIRLLLQKPDILLLDEPTNHLDIAAVEWLERYLQSYEHAVVMVSHDRFFLDRVADVVYEVSEKKLVRYAGNYTQYRQEKRKRLALQKKAYERQQEELARLNEVIERFKHKPKKASFARAKKKQIERMKKLEKPMEDEVHLFPGELTPLVTGSKWVLEAKHLKLGYEHCLLEVSMRIRRGQKIGILGANGAGKSTFLKTIAGLIRPYEGKFSLGQHVTLGYFDQHAAQMQSKKSVLEHFHERFPSMTEKEVRSTLGAFLFTGKDAARKVCALSGGERARLALAELLQSRPNFLVLDEPTNHMDILAKETLEAAFQAYTGTMLFVSHDRYFIRQVADAMLIFDGQSVMYYPFGYEHYLERSRKAKAGESLAAQVNAEAQALIAGMRAVPKAEHHWLGEISTEEAHLDWKLRLAIEQVKPAAERYENAERVYQELLLEYQQAPEYWEKLISGEENRKQEKLKEIGAETAELEAEWKQRKKEQLERAEYLKNTAWLRWHEACMEWWDTLESEKNS